MQIIFIALMFFAIPLAFIATGYMLWRTYSEFPEITNSTNIHTFDAVLKRREFAARVGTGFMSSGASVAVILVLPFFIVFSLGCTAVLSYFFFGTTFTGSFDEFYYAGEYLNRMRHHDGLWIFMLVPYPAWIDMWILMWNFLIVNGGPHLWLVYIMALIQLRFAYSLAYLGFALLVAAFIKNQRRKEQEEELAWAEEADKSAWSAKAYMRHKTGVPFDTKTFN